VRCLSGAAQDVELGDTVDGMYRHQFTEAELTQELAAAGFALESWGNSVIGYAVAAAA
jgi:hypothetical protein